MWRKREEINFGHEIAEQNDPTFVNPEKEKHTSPRQSNAQHRTRVEKLKVTTQPTQRTHQLVQGEHHQKG